MELNTFVIDMTKEKGKRFILNGEPMDVSNVKSMDIHIKYGKIFIETLR